MSPKERLEFFLLVLRSQLGMSKCCFLLRGWGMLSIFVFVQNVAYEEDCESGTKEIGRSHSKSKQHINGKSIIIIIILR